jgi:hypothetical protein
MLVVKPPIVATYVLNVGVGTAGSADPEAVTLSELINPTLVAYTVTTAEALEESPELVTIPLASTMLPFVVLTT